MNTILTQLVSNIFSIEFYDSNVVQTLYQTSNKLNVMTHVFIFLLQNILSLLSCVHIQNYFIFELDFGWTIFLVFFTLLAPRKFSGLVNVCVYFFFHYVFLCCCVLHLFLALFLLLSIFHFTWLLFAPHLALLFLDPCFVLLMFVLHPTLLLFILYLVLLLFVLYFMSLFA